MSVEFREPARRPQPKANWLGTLKKRKRKIELRRTVYGTSVLIIVERYRTGGYTQGYGHSRKSTPVKWDIRTTLSMNGKLTIPGDAFIPDMVEVIAKAKDIVKSWDAHLYEDEVE